MDGEQLYRCPVRPYKVNPRWFNELFFQYNLYKEGHFPEPGTWKDQSARLLLFFHTIDRAIADADRSKQDTQNAKRATAAKKGKDPYATRANMKT